MEGGLRGSEATMGSIARLKRIALQSPLEQEVDASGCPRSDTMGSGLAGLPERVAPTKQSQHRPLAGVADPCPGGSIHLLEVDDAGLQGTLSSDQAPFAAPSRGAA